MCVFCIRMCVQVAILPLEVIFKYKEEFVFWDLKIILLRQENCEYAQKLLTLSCNSIFSSSLCAYEYIFAPSYILCTSIFV